MHYEELFFFGAQLAQHLLQLAVRGAVFRHGIGVLSDGAVEHELCHVSAANVSVGLFWQ